MMRITLYTVNVPISSFVFPGWFFLNRILIGAVIAEVMNLGRGNMNGALDLYFE